MSNLIKFLWTIISLTPLLFIIDLVLLADYFNNKTLCRSWITLVIIAVVIGALTISCIIIVCLAKRHLSPTTLTVNEAETKDSDMATSMLSYLIPLITLAITDVNWVALGGVMFVMFIILSATKIILLNPLMYLLGYRYFSIKVHSGMKYILLTTTSKPCGKTLKVIELFSGYYLEIET